MIFKAFQLLKRNPVIILFYVIFMFLSLAILLLLYPKDLSQFYGTAALQGFNFSGYMIAMMRILMASSIIFILGLLFCSGFGYMLKESVMNGKTSAASFPKGISKYFVRILLTFLLLMAMAFGLSIVLNIIVVPLTIVTTLSGSSTAFLIPIIFLIMLLVILVIPFVLLWIPAIFIEDTGVIIGLKLGWKSGIRNYGRLLLLLTVIYIPIILYILLSLPTIMEGQIFTVGYYILILIEAVISILYMPVIFFLYAEDSNKQNQLINKGMN